MAWLEESLEACVHFTTVSPSIHCRKLVRRVLAPCVHAANAFGPSVSSALVSSCSHDLAYKPPRPLEKCNQGECEQTQHQQRAFLQVCFSDRQQAPKDLGVYDIWQASIPDQCRAMHNARRR
eukprot:jgi/Ulvmu1/12361/UM009_0007.1